MKDSVERLLIARELFPILSESREHITDAILELQRQQARIEALEADNESLEKVLDGTMEQEVVLLNRIETLEATITELTAAIKYARGSLRGDENYGDIIVAFDEVNPKSALNQGAK